MLWYDIVIYTVTVWYDIVHWLVVIRNNENKIKNDIELFCTEMEEFV